MWFVHSGDTSRSSDNSRASLESFNYSQVPEVFHEDSFLWETEKSDWVGLLTLTEMKYVG